MPALQIANEARPSERALRASERDDGLNLLRGVFREKVYRWLNSLDHDFKGRREHIDSVAETLVILWWACDRTVLYLEAFLETPPENVEELGDFYGHLLASVDEVLFNSVSVDRPLRRLLEFNLPNAKEPEADQPQPIESGLSYLEAWAAEGPAVRVRLLALSGRPRYIRGLALTLVRLHADCTFVRRVFDGLAEAAPREHRLSLLSELLSVVERLCVSSRFASRKLSAL